jgi:hypothetical protein
MKVRGALSFILFAAFATSYIIGQDAPKQETARTVQYHAQDIVPIHAKNEFHHSVSPANVRGGHRRGESATRSFGSLTWFRTLCLSIRPRNTSSQTLTSSRTRATSIPSPCLTCPAPLRRLTSR